MHQHHQRRILRAIGGHGQQRRDLAAIARLVAHRRLAAHLPGIDAGIGVPDLVDLARLQVEQRVEGRAHVRKRAHQCPVGVVAGRERHQVDGARQRSVEFFLRLLHRLVEPDDAVGIGTQLHAQQFFAAAHQGTMEIVARRGHDRVRAERAGGKVDGVYRRGILVLIARHIQSAVAAETQGG
ncbi:hypothetical protein [Massilia sp. Leaf139]|uniref:hypothetical protein n=1 Tax=Massilia sp. Leaf139 TaxID=1736272 RepID=UPI001E4C0D49|nr:hypothetical protein [Massilia sp. Leaf139]